MRNRPKYVLLIRLTPYSHPTQNNHSRTHTSAGIKTFRACRQGPTRRGSGQRVLWFRGSRIYVSWTCGGLEGGGGNPGHYFLKGYLKKKPLPSRKPCVICVQHSKKFVVDFCYSVKTKNKKNQLSRNRKRRLPRAPVTEVSSNPKLTKTTPWLTPDENEKL